MQYLYILTLTIAFISNSVLIYILNKRSERATSLILFILFLLTINIWGVPQIIINLFELDIQAIIINLFELDIQAMVLIDKVSAFGYVFLPVVFFHFALSYTNKLSIIRNNLLVFVFLVYLPALLFLFLSWNTNLIDKRYLLNQNFFGWGHGSPPGPLFPIFLIWFEALMISALFLIAHLYTTSRDTLKKRQSLGVTIAIVIPLFFGTITDGVLPTIGHHIFPAAVPLSSIMALIISYVVFHYELFYISSRAILSSIGNGVITVNTSGQIVHINNYAKGVLGFIKIDLHNQLFEKAIPIVPEDSSSPSINPVTQVLQNQKKLISNKYLFLSTSNKKIPVEFSITPVYQENQKLIGVTIVFRDITKEKELEKIKNEFISIASHELKTPVTSIIY
jgi:PAS domain S-box-containing protein